MRALVANVSHDLKTPMTSIAGYAQALSDGTADTADARRIGDVIREEALHVNVLLADLLYLGEIDAGQVITKHEDLPLETILGPCLRRIDSVARAKDLDVIVDLAPEARLRDVDSDKLERAFTNVLDNAAKFTPAGGEITVVGRCENGAGPARVVCTVTNTGTTIPGDDLSRVFDRFFRGDRARRTVSGSGLGLAITRELVELNRGTIEAANEPGGGVTFTMTLPA
jgi:signal transduction histidine kinase